jgi:CheY-like chemotaxis protein
MGSNSDLSRMKTNVKRILIIDDEEDVLLFLADRLKALGYEVLTATNGRDGLNLLNQHSVHGVLLDLHMPVMGGLAMLDHLEKWASIPPVIVMSATEYHSELQRAIEKGAKDILNKPIAQEELTGKCLRLFH